MGKMAKALGMVAAAAAGAYYLYKKNPKVQTQVRGWMLKMKGEVLAKLERLKDVNEEAYHELVDQTAKRYRVMKEVNGGELKGIVNDMKSAWTTIRKELKAADSANGQD